MTDFSYFEQQKYENLRDEQKNADANRASRQRDEDSSRMYEQRDADAMRYYQVQAERAKTTYEQANALAAQRTLLYDNDPSYGGVKRGLEQQRAKSGSDKYYVQHSRDVASQYAQQQTLYERALNEPDRQLTTQQLQTLQKEATNFFSKKESAHENLRSAPLESKINAGTAQIVDKQFFDIADKGNTKFQVNFYQQASQMGAAMYQVHLDRQDELAKSYTAAEKLGDKELANTIRDRQEYESLAYERDRGMSYLSTCEALYGRESKQFKEQEVDVKELASQADRAHEKMMESHRILKERDQSQKLESEQTLQQEATKKKNPEQNLKTQESGNEMNRKQDDAKNVDIERLQDVQASMKQTLAEEKAAQEKAELDANLKRLKEHGPLVESRLEDYENSKKELDAFLTQEEKIQRAHEEGREISKDDAKQIHKNGEAADLEAKADKRQTDIESEQQRLNVEPAKPVSKEGSISKEQRYSEIDKALTKAKEADSDFKQQVKGNIQDREKRQELSRDHYSGRMRELHDAKNNLDASRDQGLVSQIKAQDGYDKISEKVSADLKERENFAKEMIAMKEHGQAMINAKDQSAVKHHSEKFETSYQKMDALVSKAEANEKGYASEMRSKLDTGIQKLDAQEKKLAANNEMSFLTKPSSQQNDQHSLEARHEKSSKTAKQDDLSASKVSPQHDRDVGNSKKMEAGNQHKTSDVQSSKSLQITNQPAQPQANKASENESERGKRISSSVRKVDEEKANKQADHKSSSQTANNRKEEVERQVQAERERQAAQAKTEDQNRRR